MGCNGMNEWHGMGCNGMVVQMQSSMLCPGLTMQGMQMGALRLHFRHLSVERCKCAAHQLDARTGWQMRGPPAIACAPTRGQASLMRLKGASHPHASQGGKPPSCLMRLKGASHPQKAAEHAPLNRRG